MSRSRLLALATLVALLFVLSLAVGKVWIGPATWFGPDPLGRIVLELRLPRAVLALLLGGGLGLAGAALQGYLRNPLADPAVIGVSSAAALGAVAAILAGTGATGSFAAAMGAGVTAMALLAALAWRPNNIGAGAVTLVLAGTVLASLAGALTALLIALAPNPYAVAAVIDWLMGALTDRGWPDVVRAAPGIVVGAGLLLATGRALDALTLGEEAARSLGVSLGRTQALVVAGAGLIVGAGVAATGVIGFVGLIVPHLLRPIVGARPGALLVPSALGGAALLLAGDSLCRLAPGAGEVPLGVVTALIGAPFFLWLLWRGEVQAWR